MLSPLLLSELDDPRTFRKQIPEDAPRRGLQMSDVGLRIGKSLRRHAPRTMSPRPSLVQVFFFPGSGMASFLIGVVGVLIFTGLTAWDVQRIKNGQVPGLNAESASVMGALSLYLDFVNLFLMLLRIFGSNR